MRILINAISVKKRGGGIFQIATNFILNSLNDYSNEIEWYYLISEDLHEVLQQYSFSKEKNYFVYPTQPNFTGSYYKVRKGLKLIEKSLKPQVVYSLASPSYFSFKAPEVMRFANAWITNPNKYAYSTLSVKGRVRNKLYTINQKRLMRKRRFFITQSETVKNGILSNVETEAHNVKVISNVLPAIYLDKRDDLLLNQKNDKDIIYIACVAAPNPHKNLDILPSVLKYLRDEHGIENAVFLTTLPDDSSLFIQLKQELTLMNLENRVVNYGYCSQEKLIELYSKCEICFMPTLLETFSATLLEAMFFNLAIVTSDFDFNREVVGDSALYHQPMDAKDAADKLALLIKDETYRGKLKNKMSPHLKKYSSFDNYMEETISFLAKVAEKTN